LTGVEWRFETNRTDTTSRISTAEIYRIKTNLTNTTLGASGRRQVSDWPLLDRRRANRKPVLVSLVGDGLASVSRRGWSGARKDRRLRQPEHESYEVARAWAVQKERAKWRWRETRAAAEDRKLGVTLRNG
jgi:hypothetical protein